MATATYQLSVLFTSFCAFSLSGTGIYICEAACPGDGSNVIQYNPISPPYDRNYSSITDAGTHPLGFYRGVWHYNQAGMSNPCIKITADKASTRKLEIKVDHVKDQNSAEECFQGRYVSCRESPGDSVYIEFLCNSQCEEADVLFWYRLTLSKLPSEEDLDLFCLNTGSEFPEDLMELPPGVTFPTYTTPGGPSGQGSTFQPWVLLTVLLIVCQSFL
ncbi:hypothetical protein BaRGS_00009289 [Batillaria attramentaria]|uniref:Uncharacterized protein n=1 Tax=Batillaria attramentaria TaxID=370345 RepID=A0ABD0LJE6_9CAEN